MPFCEALLWPGTKICEYPAVDPEGDAGLIRSMFNIIAYLYVILTVLLVVMS
jgi:hypothetical protein